MTNYNIMKIIKKTVVFSLILAMGLGFFVGSNANAETAVYDQIGQFDVPATSIYMYGDDAYFASGTIGKSEGGEYLSYFMNVKLELWENAGPYNWGTSSRITSIVVSKDGRTIYFSGLFTHVNGVERNGMAAVDLTGNLLDWHPQVEGRAYVEFTMSPEGDYIYAYGGFKNADNTVYYDVMKVRTSDARVMSWKIAFFNDPDYEYWQMEADGTSQPVYIPRYVFATSDEKLLIIAGTLGSANTTIATLRIFASDAREWYPVNYAGYGSDRGYPWGGAAFINKNNDLYYAERNIAGQGYASDIMGMDIIKGYSVSIAKNVGQYLPIIESNSDGSKIYAVSRVSGLFDEIMLVDRTHSTISKLELPTFRFIDTIKISPNDRYLYISGTLGKNYDQSQYGKWRPGDIIRVDLTASANDISVSQDGCDMDFAAYAPDAIDYELLKLPNQATVYYSDINHRIWRIKNEEAFLAWGLKWEDISVRDFSTWQTVMGKEMDAPYSSPNLLANGTLVKGSSPTVYVVSCGKLHAIKSAAIFEALGFRWDKIKIFPDATITRMEHGEDVASLKHPDGLVIKYSGSPAVYYIENGMKRVFLNAAVFENKNLSWSQIIDVGADVTYPDGELISL